MRDQSGNITTMKASSYNNQGYENDRNPLSPSFIDGGVSPLAAQPCAHDSTPTQQNLLANRCSPSGIGYNLRKRSFNGDSPVVGLSTYNSDFLSGLFADIAKASVIDEALT